MKWLLSVRQWCSWVSIGSWPPCLPCFHNSDERKSSHSNRFSSGRLVNQILTVISVPSSGHAAQWAGCFFLWYDFVFFIFLTSLLFNIHHMHIMQIGKKVLNPCITEKTDWSYYCQPFTMSSGICVKLFILNGFHENKGRNTKVYTSKSILFIWFPVLSMHSVFLLPFLVVVLKAGVPLKSLTIP